MSAATLITTLVMNDSEFQAKVRRATQTSQEFGDSLGKAGDKANSKMKTLVGAIAAVGVAYKATQTLFGALKEEAQFETTGLNIETLVGDADKAKGIIEDLQNFALNTSVEFKPLTDGARTLLAFGVAADSIVPSLITLGEIAGGNTEKLERLTLAFAQTSSAGRLTGQDLLQYVNAGFNPLEEIAKKTGETMIQLRKRMEAGGIAFGEVSDAMATATSEGGRFFGFLDKQSQGTAAKAAKLTESWTLFKRAIAEPINDVLGPILVSAADIIAKSGPAAAAIGQGIASAVSAIAGFFETMYKGITGLGILIETVFTKAMEDVLLNVLPDFLKVPLGIDGVDARSMEEIFDEVSAKSFEGPAGAVVKKLTGLVDGAAGAANGAALSAGAAADKLKGAGAQFKSDLDEAGLIARDAGRNREFGATPSIFTGLESFFGGNRTSASPKLAGLEGGGMTIDIDQGEVVGALSEVAKEQRITNSLLGDLKFDVE